MLLCVWCCIDCICGVGVCVVCVGLGVGGRVGCVGVCLCCMGLLMWCVWCVLEGCVWMVIGFYWLVVCVDDCWCVC